jgi:hypothetical protein
MQPVLSVPACKCARHVHALALALVLDQRRHRRPPRAGLPELVAQLLVVGCGGAEDGQIVPRQGALDLIVVDGAEDGRARLVVLLLDGQRQARRAVELRGGHHVLVLRGIGGVDGRRGVVWPAGGCGGHIDGACLLRGRGRARGFWRWLLLRLVLRLLGREGVGSETDMGRGGVAWEGIGALLLALALGLLVAHGAGGGVVRGWSGVGGSVQLIRDDGGASRDRLRGATRGRAGRRRRGMMRLGVLERSRWGCRLRLDLERRDRLPSLRRWVWNVCRDV